MKLVIIDNYDSFTYNLVQLLEQAGAGEFNIIKNDDPRCLKLESYTHIVLSPGPGLPSEAGLLEDVIRKYGAEKRILGVCLGHQAIAEVFGGKIIQMENILHGIATDCIILQDNLLFEKIESPFTIGRYHSWVVEEHSLPKSLLITAKDENGYIMAMRHKKHDIRSVQFHPESIMTPDGLQMIQNWINYSAE
ncbi:MAG: aminodeoxychorismate/anthranilate synthase component II [Bacteroidales bacterium]|nr:aminodeoxychorismate/anthranilate synthase component II [Bacteroidales bacterium]